MKIYFLTDKRTQSVPILKSSRLILCKDVIGITST